MKSVEIDQEFKDLTLAIGEKIKELRKQKNIGYIQISKEIGISRNCYNSLELGKQPNFQFLTLPRILKYHNVSFFQFIESLKR